MAADQPAGPLPMMTVFSIESLTLLLLLVWKSGSRGKVGDGFVPTGTGDASIGVAEDPPQGRRPDRKARVCVSSLGFLPLSHCRFVHEHACCRRRVDDRLRRRLSHVWSLAGKQ